MSEQSGYELLMPFVVVQSVGGPYEDTAYVAGYEAGRIEALREFFGYVHTPNVPQVDLIAMKKGLCLKLGDRSGDWTFVEVSR